MVKKEGYCSICGQYRELTNEHVPPKGAFNNQDYVLAFMKDDDPFGEPIRQEFRQGGIKFRTLCKSCNNNTGSWYGKDYIDYCMIGVEILKRTNGNPSLYYVTKIYPLRIIKQVISMFFSINTSSFQKNNLYLVRFVLNKEVKNLPNDIKLYAYYNWEGEARYQPISVLGKPGTTTVITEFTYRPYGFVLTFNESQPLDSRYKDITWFANYRYNEKRHVDWILNTLQTWMPFPGDYRTKDEIDKDIAKNKLAKKKMDSGKG